MINDVSSGIKCDVCGSGALEHLYDKIGEGSRILKCPTCGLAFIYPQSVPGKELDSYYQDSAAVNDNDLVRFRKMVKRLDSPVRRAILSEIYGYSNLRTGRGRAMRKLCALLMMPFYCKGTIPFQGQGRILDIGCGSGLSLALLKNIGWDVYGVEVNKFACDHAAKMGVKIFCGELDKAGFAPEFFDVIKITHVLEHVSSPDRTFSRMKSILKPGGAIYLETPNFKSFAASCFKEKWLGMGAHVTGFSAKTLSYIGKKYGLSMKNVRFKSSKGVVLESLDNFWRNKFKASLPASVLKNGVFSIFFVKPLCAVLNLFRMGDTISVKFVVNGGMRNEQTG